MVSDQQVEKKEAETEALDLFLEAYELVTGRVWIVRDQGESPDFICIDAGGEIMGIELTRVTRRRDLVNAEQIYDRFGEMDPSHMLMTIRALIERKEEMRTAYRTSKTILVLTLVDGSLDGLIQPLAQLNGDIGRHGFTEIWLADYSGVAPYGDVELFGLFPPEWWGYHPRPWADRKPYG